ncbi:hypothetical protein JTB14_001728 [Gonioctena quinquepunctata]|nr:hypothetical protein JTB14_001728 [Gonioctena quinquepunctata]
MNEKDMKNYNFLTIYKKDYIKKTPKPSKKFLTIQEFKDPINEGFRNYLEIDKANIEKPFEDGDVYLTEVKGDRKKIGKMYFGTPLDHITIQGNKLTEGKSIYQVDYCDIEEDIRQKLIHGEGGKYHLPEGWIIPETTYDFNYRDPIFFSEHALDPPTIVKPMGNLGPNEKINNILNVKTGDSEYNHTYGKLGGFIVENQMHGKINHPKCSCEKHTIKRT